MMFNNIGPTTISICESTANVTVHMPTETYLNEIVSYVFDNNYVCKCVYHDNIEIAKKLATKIGGEPTSSEDRLKQIEEIFE